MMLSKTERLFARMARDDFGTVTAAYTRRCAIENEQTESLEAWVEEQGYEAVGDSGPMTADGREVIAVNGKRWALRPEIHAERLNQRMAEAQEREAAKRAAQESETKSVAGTDTLSALTCPKCGDSLQHALICPNCAGGKAGYRHRYICVCGVDFVTREEL